MHGWCSPEVVRLLLTRGAGVDAVARDLRRINSTQPRLATSHTRQISDRCRHTKAVLSEQALRCLHAAARGADVSHLFEERLHLATEERPHPCRATRPLVNRLATDRHRTYVEAVHAAGGFPAYARTASASCSRSSSRAGTAA